MTDVIVIGGGPAGFTAAIFAAKRGLSVKILDKNRKRVLAKLVITGKGRCNLTNNCTNEEFFDNVLRGGKFLRSSISTFGPKEIMEFFEGLGVPLKTERGRRVFPQSDRSLDICSALEKEAARLGVEVLSKQKASGIKAEDALVSGVILPTGETIPCKAVVLATGGLSYPLTGSDGDGYRIARMFGHTVTDTSPSLVSLTCSEEYISSLEGLSLKNVSLTCKKGKKEIFSEQGEMMFTDKGITGPLVLSLSSVIACMEKDGLSTFIDLKPALDEQTLDKRILKDFSQSINKDFRNSLDALLPKSIIPVIVKLSGIDPGKKVNAVTSKERTALCQLIKRFPVTITGTGGYNEAVVTAGGIKTSEVNPRTMESKLVKNLHFAGEILDCDAYTGGYNLTIAFATGHAAGTSILREEEEL